MLTAAFFLAELILSPLFGMLSDRLGSRPVMQFGPVFGAVAVVMTALTTDLFLLGTTRWLEGAAAAASIPSILGYIALATSHDEGLRGRTVAQFEAATLAGLGLGLVAAGGLWAVLDRNAFYLNAVLYGVSFLIYRYGVTEGRPGTVAEAAPRGRGDRRGRRRPAWPAASTSRAIGGVLAQRVGLAAGADVDRHQRVHRRVDEPVDLPAGQRASAGLRGPAADGRLRAGAGQHRPCRRAARVLRRPVLLGKPLQALSAHDDHGHRRRRRHRHGRGQLRAQPRGDLAPDPQDRPRDRRRGWAVRAGRRDARRRSACWPTSARSIPTIAARSWASTRSSWPSAR